MAKAKQSESAVIEGMLVVEPSKRFAIVASRFNGFIVERLIDGARDALLRHGARNVRLVRVPGSWELVLACHRLAEKGRVDGIVALGALIRGATAHFDYLAAQVTKGLAGVQQKTGVPVGFGVLTTDTIEQAIERAGAKAGNKGAEAALAVIEMVSLLGRL